VFNFGFLPGRGESSLDKALAGAFNGDAPEVKRASNLVISQAIGGLQQNASASEFARRMFAATQKLMQQLTFWLAEINQIFFLWHRGSSSNRGLLTRTTLCQRAFIIFNVVWY
jgi:hypothetical protein